MSKCSRKDMCYHYPSKCDLCNAISDIINHYPCFQDKDIVKVVRCKDCVHYEPYQKPVEDFDGACFARCCETDEQDFCNYGKRKTN